MLAVGAASKAVGIGRAGVTQINGAAVEVHIARRAAVGSAKSVGGIVHQDAARGADAIDRGAAGESVVARVGRTGAIAIQCEHPGACFHKAQVTIDRSGKGGANGASHAERRSRSSRAVGDAATEVDSAAGASDLTVVAADALDRDAGANQIKGRTGADVQLAVHSAEGIRGTQLQCAALHTDFAMHGTIAGKRKRATTKLGKRIGQHCATDRRILAILHINQCLTRRSRAWGCRIGGTEQKIGTDRVAAVDEDAAHVDVVERANGQRAAVHVRRGAEGIDAVITRERLHARDVTNAVRVAARQAADRRSRVGLDAGRNVISGEVRQARAVGGDQVRCEDAIHDG